MTDVLHRIPVVAGLGYVEQVRRLPSAFRATLVPEPDNRYFRHALAVIGSGGKVGYVAPEIAIRYYDAVRVHPEPVTCPGRRSGPADHSTSGVELLLDFSGLPVVAAE